MSSKQVYEMIKTHTEDITLIGTFDQDTGDAHISIDVPDNVVINLIKKHSCMISSDPSGGYYVCIPDSLDSFVEYGINKSARLAIEGSNDSLIYSNDDDELATAWLLPAVRTGRWPDKSSISQLISEFNERVDDIEGVHKITQGLSEELVERVTTEDTTESVKELLNVMSLLNEYPYNIHVEDDVVDLVSFRVLPKETIYTINTSGVTFNTLSIQEINGEEKLVTSDPNLIANLRLELIRRTIEE
jgi:hypothetical protein